MNPTVVALFALAALAVTGGFLLLRRPRRSTGVLVEDSYKVDDIIARLDDTVADLSNVPAQLRRSRTDVPVLPSDLRVMLRAGALPDDALVRIDEEFSAPAQNDVAPILPEDLFAPGAVSTPRRKVRLRPERLVAAPELGTKNWSPQTGYVETREPTWVELGLPEDVPESYLDVPGNN